MATDTGIPVMVMRGGTSKGLYFLQSDLPADDETRDRMLMQVMGTPDPRQIDGMGGAHPLTSKAAIVGRCTHRIGDVDYLFLQVGVDKALVTDRQNCGNLLAGVGPFAIERDLFPTSGAEATVRIHMLNTDAIATAGFALRGGLPEYDGDTAISGVPGTAAPIRLDFENIAGGSCGSLLPTGNTVDLVSDVPVTLIDNGMPVVVMRAADVGVTGYESCVELENDTALRERLEDIRLAAGLLMGLGDVSATTVPKLTLVASPKLGGSIGTRTFNPHRCHPAIGVLGAVSVATAALLPDSPAADVYEAGHAAGTITLEHPTGTFDAVVGITMVNGSPRVERAGIVRTARKLMDGLVFPRAY